MRRENLGKCPVTGKIRFPRQKVANTALKEAQAQGWKLTRVYRCQFCQDWHLTKQEEKGELKCT